jgi:hypothetical protein
MSKHGAGLKGKQRKAEQAERAWQAQKQRDEAIKAAREAAKPKPYVLFLDDERDPEYCRERGLDAEWPSGAEVRVARSTAEAIAIVEQHGTPAFCAFDHDLGPEDTTMKFLDWFVNVYTPKFVPDYHVHSMNPVGAANIRAFMDSWERVHETMYFLQSVMSPLL